MLLLFFAPVRKEYLMEPITMNIPVLALRGLTAFPNERRCPSM